MYELRKFFYKIAMNTQNFEGLWTALSYPKNQNDSQIFESMDQKLFTYFKMSRIYDYTGFFYGNNWIHM